MLMLSHQLTGLSLAVAERLFRLNEVPTPSGWLKPIVTVSIVVPETLKLKLSLRLKERFP